MFMETPPLVSIEVDGNEIRLSESKAREVYKELGKALARCVMDRCLSEGFRYATNNRVLGTGNDGGKRKPGDADCS
jgi:hypothetical protein